MAIFRYSHSREHLSENVTSGLSVSISYTPIRSNISRRMWWAGLEVTSVKSGPQFSNTVDVLDFHLASKLLSSSALGNLIQSNRLSFSCILGIHGFDPIKSNHYFRLHKKSSMVLKCTWTWHIFLPLSNTPTRSNISRRMWWAGLKVASESMLASSGKNSWSPNGCSKYASTALPINDRCCCCSTKERFKSRFAYG
jgi:hypothetical protein